MYDPRPPEDPAYWDNPFEQLEDHELAIAYNELLFSDLSMAELIAEMQYRGLTLNDLEQIYLDHNEEISSRHVGCTCHIDEFSCSLHCTGSTC